MEILKYIKNNFTLQPYKIKGLDSRFHTVYIIIFENGSFYIGKHTSDNLTKDKYFASGKLPVYLKNKNVNYQRLIISYEETSENAILKETLILQDTNVYNRNECLNCYQGSPPDLTGSITVSKGDNFKMINLKLLDHYISKGWSKGGLSYRHINNGIISTKVLNSKLKEYTDLGWSVGGLSNVGKTFIRKGGILKFIDRDMIDPMLEKGWYKCGNVSGRKVIEKDGVIKKVEVDKLSEYIKDGWEKSSCVKGLVSIIKGSKVKRVPLKILDEYIANGWVKGNNVSGTIYVNKGSEECRISSCQLKNYESLGWLKGRIKKLYLNNGVIERRVRETDVDILNSLLCDGFKYGALRKRTMLLTPKGNLSSVKPCKVNDLLNKGYKLIKELRP